MVQEICTRPSQTLSTVSRKKLTTPTLLAISSTSREKFGFSISGLLGVHLAKNPWLTIRKCLRKERKIGLAR